MREQPLPPSISGNRLKWLFAKPWHLCHSYNKQFSCLFAAAPGAGKSWLTLSFAETLDRTYVHDESRFSIDRVAFSAREFSALVARDDMPVGSAVVFDDIGLHAFSRESMMREVKLLSKTFQMMRYKRLCILLSLPSVSMLDKNIRMLATAYCQPVKIDYEHERTFAKFQWISFSPKKGDVYYKRPVVLKHRNVCGYETVVPTTINGVWFDKPSDLLCEQYEKKKKTMMDEWARQTADKIAIAEYPVEKKNLFEEVRAHTEQYADSNGVVKSHLILGKNRGVSLAQAKNVARDLNAANGFVWNGRKYVRATHTQYQELDGGL